MHDHRQNMARLDEIRSRMAIVQVFRGFGPLALLVTALLAIMTGSFLFARLPDPSVAPIVFFGAWILTALGAAAVIGLDVATRSRFHHGGMAPAMIAQAARLLLPAGAAGAAILVVFWTAVPNALWLLPGLWSLLVALGLAAAIPFLPKGTPIVAIWYAAGGLIALGFGAGEPIHATTAMTILFGIGQSLMALVAFFDHRNDGEPHSHDG